MAKTSTKILFLFPYPSGTAASQRFRFEQYFEALEAEGFCYERQAFIDEQTWEILYQPGHYLQKTLGILRGFGRRLLMLARLHRYDYVFVHREASPLGPPVFEWLIAKVFRKKLIFDFDDAIWLPNTSKQNAAVAWLKFHQKTAWICRWAYKISAGNDYLVNYAKQFNEQAYLNPTTIDTEQHHNRTKVHCGRRVVLGWTGTHSTLKYLVDLLPVLQDLEKTQAFELLVISDKAPDFQLKSLVFCPWDKTQEIEDLLQMDIGLMPLKRDKWAEGKCGFKALQYMALGIPAVVSPVGVNQKIVQEGENGFVCDSAESWQQAITKLIENQKLRQKMGAKARESIIKHYSVISNRENFLGLFS